ncbi:hypothetical protein PLCT1_01981 [Planctomycetaceae bacterium]|nr:hypothetical protein PLCT1_01981 [Planctomycetaceae bacterium]
MPGSEIGIVVIGRNEGERLRRCIASAQGTGRHVVYVDSGSTDGSAQWAQSQGVDVVALDMAQPFTAARARNEGVRRLREQMPQLELVQFVDGDCELAPGWLDGARRFLAQRTDVACVCGRLRERHPERSVYNRLCDIEWNRPVGETDACGGIAMMRADAFAQAGGFREDLIAGEEPELCLRLRAQGERVWRLADEMAWHDAAMSRFGQWWRRATRGGVALAEGAALHGANAQASYRARLRKTLVWGLAVPAAIVLLGLLQPWIWAFMLVYPARIARLVPRSPDPTAGWLWAGFVVLAGFAEAFGALQYWAKRARGQGVTLIEYK